MWNNHIWNKWIILRGFMKLITFAIPSYNSEAYLDKCVESILKAGNDIEILIVNDGSKDRTAEIADQYEKDHPGIIRAIHKENGGHGDAVNYGIKNATGKYFKVVDSDDWLDEESVKQIIQLINDFESDNEDVDMIIANYVYERVCDDKRHEIKYTHVLPRNQVFGWDDIGHYLPSQYFLMHSIIYRTEVLRASGLELPKHTFYVDNLYAFVPLAKVKKMYYLNCPLYRYYIGRSDQSVNEKIMIQRVDQQIRVTDMMTEYINSINKDEIPEKLYKYLVHYLGMMYTVCSALLICDNTEESLAKRDALWDRCEKANPELYEKLRAKLTVAFTNFKGHLGIRVGSASYKLMQKIYKFN